MLHILGLIGKGIGIALLCILLLLVALLLAVLFVPIRYHVAGKLEEGKADGRAKLHWLFHIVSAFAVWDGKLRYGIRIFGITVWDNLSSAIKEEKKMARARKKEKKKPGREKAVSKPLPEEPRAVSKSLPEDEDSGEDKKPGMPGKIWEKIKSFLGMLARLWKKLLDFPRNIQEKLQGLKEKVNGWQETWNDYRNFLEREDFKRAFALCKKQLLSLWKNIRPRKAKLEVHFGFDDPATTGQILSYLGMMYPLLGKDIKIRPDFEKTILEGKVLIKGRITVFVLLKVLWILYFDKDIKRLIRIWKKEESLHGRK